MELPLILAGPVLRRVESNSVSVWLALREQCTVKLSIWEDGQVKAGEREPLLAGGPDPAVPALHVSEVGRGEGSSSLRFDSWNKSPECE